MHRRDAGHLGNGVPHARTTRHTRPRSWKTVLAQGFTGTQKTTQSIEIMRQA